MQHCNCAEEIRRLKTETVNRVADAEQSIELRLFRIEDANRREFASVNRKLDELKAVLQQVLAELAPSKLASVENRFRDWWQNLSRSKNGNFIRCSESNFLGGA